MKKLLVLGLAVLGGAVAVRRMSANRAEQDLWHQATTARDFQTGAAPGA
ncbi:MAG TPA: DLW-39 family protein [Mycobacteriales bacterium]|nr:DLW-39 family protein [Mycobacteriales bacterium]